MKSILFVISCRKKVGVQIYLRQTDLFCWRVFQHFIYYIEYTQLQSLRHVPVPVCNTRTSIRKLFHGKLTMSNFGLISQLQCQRFNQYNFWETRQSNNGIHKWHAINEIRIIWYLNYHNFRHSLETSTYIKLDFRQCVQCGEVLMLCLVFKKKTTHLRNTAETYYFLGLNIKYCEFTFTTVSTVECRSTFQPSEK